MIKLLKYFAIFLGVGILGLVGYYLATYGVKPVRLMNFRAFMRDPKAHQDWMIRAGETCA